MQYKVIKDLPFAKAGKIVEIVQDSEDSGARGFSIFWKHTDGLTRNAWWEDEWPDPTTSGFFEEVVEGIWKPENQEEYFYIDSEGDSCFADWVEYTIDNDRLENFNVFQTQKLAREAAVLVKETLKKFHESKKVCITE